MLKMKIATLEEKLSELNSLHTKLKQLEKEWSNIQIKEECNQDNFICPER